MMDKESDGGFRLALKLMLAFGLGVPILWLVFHG